MARNWGAAPNQATNKQLADMTGYTGDFGGGQFDKFMGTYAGDNASQVEQLRSSRTANPAVPLSTLGPSAAQPAGIVAGAMAPPTGGPAPQSYYPYPQPSPSSPFGDDPTTYRNPGYSSLPQPGATPAPNTQPPEYPQPAGIIAASMPTSLANMDATTQRMLADQQLRQQSPLANLAEASGQIGQSQLANGDQSFLDSIGGIGGLKTWTDQQLNNINNAPISDQQKSDAVRQVNAQYQRFQRFQQMQNQPTFGQPMPDQQQNWTPQKGFDNPLAHLSPDIQQRIADHQLRNQAQYANLPPAQRVQLAQQQIANHMWLKQQPLNLAHPDVNSPQQIQNTVADLQRNL